MVHERVADSADVETNVTRGGKGGSLSSVFAVISDDAGPAPFVLNAWTENVYAVAFLKLFITASSLGCECDSIVLNVYGLSDPSTL